MPRYYFNVTHSESATDSEGTEFADLSAARVAAVTFFGEMIKDNAGAFWDQPAWRLEVADSRRVVLFALDFTADPSITPEA